MSDLAPPVAHPATRVFVAANTVATAAVMTFLIWLVYFNRGSVAAATDAPSSLPALNATLNAASAVLVLAAWIAVRRRRFKLHAALMVGALTTSACFLVSYVYYHLHYGDTPFTGTGWVRPLYFAILISHIVLSVITFPMILTSMFLALTRRFRTHRRVSRYTWAAWMYVSVTGVIVFLMLHT